MKQISRDLLLAYNSQGLIPGPHESEEAFKERAAYCLKLKQTLRGSSQNEIPFLDENTIADEATQEAFKKARFFYDVAPEWLPIYFSNYKLTPWHGGCAWIFQQKEHSPISAFLQLRKAFEKQKTYLGMYHRDEIAAHECAHVGRMVYEEPQFEEFFAYRSSDNKFRRYFGPLVQNSFESSLFLFVIIVIGCLDLSTLFSGNQELFLIFSWFKVIPLFMITYALLRLYKRHTQLRKCWLNIFSIVASEEKSNAITYRLTDEEIKTFAELTKEAIIEYAVQSAKDNLRWQAIVWGYLENENEAVDPMPMHK